MKTTLTVRNVPCENKMFRGLLDAYTGEPLDVRLTVSPRRGVSYFAFIKPGRYAPYSHVTYRTPQEAMQALTQRGGVTGMVEQESCLFCPYTNDALIIKRCKGGVRVEGGWNPYIPFQGAPETYVYNCSMRKGVAPEGVTKEAPHVAAVTDETIPPKENPDAKLKDEYEEKGGEIMDAVEKEVKNQVKVAMPGISMPSNHNSGKEISRVDPADTPLVPSAGVHVAPVVGSKAPKKPAGVNKKSGK